MSMNITPLGAGRDSFDLIDANKLFGELNLSEGMALLDAGCGIGRYSLVAARYLVDQGRVFALDLWKEGLNHLKGAIIAREIPNVLPVIADIGQGIPLKCNEVDVCLSANVFHGLVPQGKGKGSLREIARVLKPGGSLAIIEFKKIAGPPGPPFNIRIGVSELSAMVAPHGFRQTKVVDIGPYNYLTLYQREGD